MDRRHALRMLGAVAIAPRFLDWEPDALIDGVRAHVHEARRAQRPRPAQPHGPYQFQLFDEHQRATVSELGELIIPATDTPGAKAAKVDEFIDVILAEWATEPDRALFLNGLADVDARAITAGATDFLGATSGQRAAICTVLDNELTAARAAGWAWKAGAGPRPASHRQHFWHHMRSLTVSGYYTSEVGFKVERKEIIVPGIYHPCMPVAGR